MKTTVKNGNVTWYTPMQDRVSYPVGSLVNGADITALIREYEVLLKPCPCCGNEKIRINYFYIPDDEYPKTVAPDTPTDISPYNKNPVHIIQDGWKIVTVEYPHFLYAECPTHQITSTPVDKGCGIRTHEWHAEDDETDFREALRVIVETWNRRTS